MLKAPGFAKARTGAFLVGVFAGVLLIGAGRGVDLLVLRVVQGFCLLVLDGFLSGDV